MWEDVTLISNRAFKCTSTCSKTLPHQVQFNRKINVIMYFLVLQITSFHARLHVPIKQTSKNLFNTYRVLRSNEVNEQLSNVWICGSWPLGIHVFRTHLATQYAFHVLACSTKLTTVSYHLQGKWPPQNQGHLIRFKRFDLFPAYIWDLYKPVQEEDKISLTCVEAILKTDKILEI